jgi:hypothetical protein
MSSVAHDVIANTVAGRLDLIRQNESLRAQLAKCQAIRANLERRILELTHERDAARSEAADFKEAFEAS